MVNSIIAFRQYLRMQHRNKINDIPEIVKVEEFWNSHLCGNQFILAKFPSKEFFVEFEKFRYKKSHHLDRLIDWQSAKEKDVLEIGLGVGADATRWAQYARSFTGIDLTYESVKSTQYYFALKDLTGTIIKANVEAMPFDSNTFDICYSYGVLHHSPDINKAFNEIARVVKDGGTFILMVYAKSSINYWFRIQLFFRLRVILETFKNRLGIKTKSLIYKEHLKNFTDLGWKYLSWREFPHHCTDGPGCKIANIYNRREIVDLLTKNGFKIDKIKKAHLPLGGGFPALERSLAGIFGFHFIIWAKKI